MIGPIEERHGPLLEADATSEVEGRVPLPVAHQGIGIGLQEVLDDLVLACEHCQVQGRLFEVVEAVHHWRLGGWELGQHVQQL